MIRSLTDQSTYPDGPFFSDQLLTPGLAQGLDLNLIIGFLPSYLARLVHDVSSDASVIQGAIQLTFCLPGNLAAEASTEDLLARFIGESFSSELDAQNFVVDLLKVLNRDSVSISCLVASAGTNVTRSVIGLISTPSREDFLAFIDSEVGDDNSPIRLARSWVSGPEALVAVRFEDLVLAASRDSWSQIQRLNGDTVARLLIALSEGNFLSQVLQRKREDFENVVASDQERNASQTNFVELIVDREPDSGQEGEEIEEGLEDFGLADDLVTRDFDQLLEVLEHEEDSEAFITEFFGDGKQLQDLSWVIANRPDQLLPIREHARAWPGELEFLARNSFGTCWCGAEYDRRYGCGGE